jgi:type I restriction enzyme R subunit
MMDQYKLIAENDESTVVSDFKVTYSSEKSYQSEADLEAAFVELLQEQAYEYLPIHTEDELIANLRTQLEKLNGIEFTDGEWDRLFKGILAKPGTGVKEKTILIQEDYIQNIKRDDGTTKNVYLIDKTNIHNNTLQVIHQYEAPHGKYPNRYDVTILVNGLPLVHVELKRRGVDIKEAFNQIRRYCEDSFWSDNGLFQYIQIFVISNGTYSKYYSNTTRDRHVKELEKASTKGKQTSNSFEFTSWWTDGRNKPITDLMDFGRTFFAKHTLLSILTKYCVYTADHTLMVMRPYQIAATERILNQIRIATNYKTYGKIDAGGYVWHTTGSGKTLTSFKTAQLATKMPGIDKVLFVVDRKDLDYQTMREYDRFQKGAANSNTSTVILKRQLESSDAKIIITTIQKLSIFIKKHPQHEVYSKPIVIIFDECHRSQFGEMHHAIVKKFKKYYIFGFTGTPIIASNTQSGARPDLQTTEQIFGKRLHIYTIVNAINDKNVLPFRIEYVSTMKEKKSIEDSQVWDIDREKALMAPERISNVVSYILKHFDQKTMRRTAYYEYKQVLNVSAVASANHEKVDEKKDIRHIGGFNSIFAVSSIAAAKLYYSEFKKQMSALPSDQRLKVALIYSFEPNEEQSDGILGEENSESTEGLDQSSRDFLEGAIEDYNAMFKTNYDTSSEKFQNYYKDVSLRMKNRELDLLIVVNMFLTGFDATTLNTLWVDKNLRMHGLLQAFSRTNRILNSIKTFGNIVCFRNLEKAVNESIATFGDENAGGIVLLRKYSDYYYGYDDDSGKHYPGYKELVDQLQADFVPGSVLVGEDSKKRFIKLFGAILRAANVLSVFDSFEGQEILSEREMQDYRSMYIDLYNEMRPMKHQAEDINDDIVFEMELIKSVDITIDYILALVRKYHAGNMQDKEIVISIDKAIGGSPELRNKKALIDNFIKSLTPSSDVDVDWKAYVEAERRAELDQIIAEENLKRDKAYNYMDKSFQDGRMETSGTAITEILPPMSRFTKNDSRAIKRQTVLDRLTEFFDRFRDLVATRLTPKD